MALRRRILAAGADLPPMYKRADYIQTTGYNSRIDTGVPGNDETLVFDFDYAVITRLSYGGVFGNYADENTRCWRLINPAGTGDARNYLITAFNRRAGSSNSIIAVAENKSIIGTRVNFVISNGAVTANSEDFTRTSTYEPDGTQTISELNIAIGAPRPNMSSSNALVGRFWRFRIWSHGTLIRDYVPCVRIRDNVAGFYDRANNTFNPSIGSAQFIAGYDE
jgi:hypothetical protein